MADTGRLLLLLGMMLLVVGGVMMLFGRLNLPGDFVWRRGNMTFVFPLATSIVASILPTILLNLLFRPR
jgi:hypothetical protein